MSTTTLKARRPGRHPVPARAHPVRVWWRDASGLTAWLSLLFVVALWVAGRGLQNLGSVSGFLTSAGRLAGCCRRTCSCSNCC
ncbi:hypothetical protein [Amycolatopsis sp. cmx-4-68]|uniref:hypothetical protein n=1 Tax=Amycolatopsis sp. cmx-4-68 TaxID=2790938 RepID=UPI003979EE9D